MKKLGFMVLPLLLVVSGCSSTFQPDYVWVKDLEQMQEIEAASRNSATVNQVHWVNPPMKKVPRSEWEQRRNEQL